MKVKVKLQEKKELLIFENSKAVEIIDGFLLVHHKKNKNIRVEPIALNFLDFWEVED